MKTQRKRRLILLVSVTCVIGVAVGLILYALRQNIRFFYTPTELYENVGSLNNRQLWLGGMVQKGSVIRKNDLNVSFEITDFVHSLSVNYQGVLPDLFREGQGIVVLGSRINDQLFVAEKVLAKHDENYMPVAIKKPSDMQPKKANLMVSER